MERGRPPLAPSLQAEGAGGYESAGSSPRRASVSSGSRFARPAAALRRRVASSSSLHSSGSEAGSPRSSTASGSQPPPQQQQQQRPRRRSSLSVIRNKQTDSTNWWEENEALILHKLQADVFKGRHEQAVFVAKVMKIKKGLKDRDDLKKQLLVICKWTASSKRVDLVVHVVTLKTWSLRSSNSLQSLRVVDSCPEIPFSTLFNDSSLTLKLEFHGKTFKSRLYLVVKSLGDKSITQYTLLELCQRYFGFAPSMVGVNVSELQLMATDERYLNRCALFTDASGSAMARGRESPSNSSAGRPGPAGGDDFEAPNDDGDDGDSDDDRRTDDGRSASGNSRRRRSDDGHESQPVELLSAAEQEELLRILDAEGLASVTSGKLSEELFTRIHALEEETGSTMRQWENRGDNSDYISEKAAALSGTAPELYDPIAVLVDQLEQVHDELSDMDAWMANYNMELNTMRKDIHKIENENNRLQIQARNHESLRLHLATLLSHYAVSPDAIKVIDNLESILLQDILSEVERGVQPAQGQEPALVRLSKTATELSLASIGKAHLRHVPPRERHATILAGTEPQFAEEAHLKAINQRVAELKGQVERFCSYVRYFISNRIKSNADSFRQTIASISTSDVAQLPVIVRRDTMHRTMTPYRTLIGALQELQDDGFHSVVQVYVRDMGEAYGDVLRNFTNFMGKLAFETTNDRFEAAHRLALPSSEGARTGDHVNERRLAEALAHKIVGTAFSSQRELSLARAYAHALEQVVPMIMDEQNFLGSAFYSINEDAAGPASEAAAESEFFGRMTSDQAVRERNATLDKIFMGRADIMTGLSAFVQKAHGQRDIVQILLMLAETEAVVLEFGKRSKFLRGLLMDGPKSLRPQLEAAFGVWLEEQRAWVSSARSGDLKARPAVLGALRKLPRLIDLVTALWDESAVRHRELCPRETYDSRSSKFGQNAIGKGLEQLTMTVLQTVERLCVSSLEAADRLRVENFHFAVETLPYRGGTALQRVVLDARKEFEAALDRFVLLLLQKHVASVLTFVQEVDALLDTCEVTQLVFHKPRAALATVLQSNSKAQLRKGLENIRASACALFPENPSVLGLILASARDSFSLKYDHYVDLITEGYGDIVQPTCQEVESLAEEILILPSM